MLILVVSACATLAIVHVVGSEPQTAATPRFTLYLLAHDCEKRL